jgi:phosphatidate cytidylyltransferase
VIKRTASALVLGGAVVAAIAAGPPWLLALLLGAATLLGLREMAHLSEAKGIPFGVKRVAAGSALVLLGAYLGDSPGMNLGFAAAVISIIIAGLRGAVKGAMSSLGMEILGLLIPAWSLSHALLVMDRPAGRVELLFLLAVIWSCDTFAYIVGARWGRHRLAPEISPHKSVEGLVAGMASAPLVALAFTAWTPLPLGAAAAVFFALVFALLGQLGDLTESLLKRDAGVKDSGAIIPGHGGVLDRVDALLLALPASYYLFMLVQRAG